MDTVLHVGFHKTGTSSAEHMLLRNADRLSPHLNVQGAPHFPRAIAAAKACSERPGPARLATFRGAFADELAAGPVLVSCVDLIGHMPGLRGVADYGAAPALIGAMLEVRPAARVALSVRGAAAWLRSVWGQALKVSRLTQDHDAFAARFRDVADLEAQVRRIEAATGADVLRVPLERSALHDLGPAGPLLDLFDLPGTLSLSPQAALKVGPGDDAAQLLLEMNRSDLTDAELRAVKSDAVALMKAGT